jgi:hypothetical protein
MAILKVVKEKREFYIIPESEKYPDHQKSIEGGIT